MNGQTTITEEQSPSAKHTIRTTKILYTLLTYSPLVTLNNLCRWNNVSRRTALRDIRRLREAGIPVVYDASKGFYRIDDPNVAPGLRLHRSKLDTDTINDASNNETKENQELPPHGEGNVWPLEWGESVGLVAILLQAKSDDWQFSQVAGHIADRLIPALVHHFGDRAASILYGAKIFVRHPRDFWGTS